MAITIDWGTRVINVPQADMTLIQASPEIRELDLDWFRLQLKDLEDSEEGMCFPDTHIHNTEVDIAGFTLARVITITNGYTVTFEDGTYSVNMVGANSNVMDVINKNQVSTRSWNSAGLINVGLDPEGVADAVWDESLTGATHNVPTSAGRRLRQLGDVVSGLVDDATPSYTTFITDLTETRDDFYVDQLVRFNTDNLDGLVRPIAAYDGTSKAITVSEPMPELPDNGMGFDLIATHVHPVEEITSAIWDADTADYITAGTFGEKVGKKLLTLAKFIGLK